MALAVVEEAERLGVLPLIRQHKHLGGLRLPLLEQRREGIELSGDLGIGRHEARQQGHQAVVGIDGAHADAQHPLGVALAAGDGPLGLGDLLERLLALLPIELPVMGEAHAAGGAMEEFDAEPGLETLDGAAH